MFHCRLAYYIVSLYFVSVESKESEEKRNIVRCYIAMISSICGNSTFPCDVHCREGLMAGSAWLTHILNKQISHNMESFLHVRSEMAEVGHTYR